MTFGEYLAIPPDDGRHAGKWSLPILLFAGYAVAFMDRALIAVTAAPIKHDLALNDLQFGLLSGTAFVALYCFCGLPLGWLADRVDRRAIIATGLVVWSIMTALCGLAQSYPGLVLARIGVGLGEACLLPAGMSWLRDCMRQEQMGRAVAIFLMGSATGAVIAHVVGGFLLTHFAARGIIVLPFFGPLVSWRALFVLACPPGIAVAIFVAAQRASGPSSTGQKAAIQIRTVATQLWEGRRAYGFLTAATACSVTLTQAPAAWLPLYYVREFGLPAGRSAFDVGIMFAISVPLGQWTGGYLIDGFRSWGAAASPNVVLALSAALSVIPAAVFCSTQSLWLSQAAYVIFSYLTAAATPCGLAGWQALTPAKSMGLTTAILVSIVTLIGVGMGPAAIGLLSDQVFTNEQGLGSAMLVLSVTVAILGCLLALAGRSAFAAVASTRDGQPITTAAGAAIGPDSRPSSG